MRKGSDMESGTENAIAFTCFAVVKPDTYEVDILREQYKSQSGLFDKHCKNVIIYSSTESCELLGLKSDPSCPLKDSSSVIDDSMEFGKVPFYLTAANTPFFIKVWQHLMDTSSFEGQGFVIKADMDTVWSPLRLQKVLQPNNLNCKASPMGGHKETLEKDAVYLATAPDKGCSMPGPLEMWSYGAMRTLKAGGLGTCQEERSDWIGRFSEDTFLQKCLDFLGVQSCAKHEQGPNFLQKAYWLPKKADTCAGEQDVIAYHPYKSLDEWKECEKASNIAAEKAMQN